MKAIAKKFSPFILIMLFSGRAYAAPFSDTEKHWAKDAIDRLYNKKIVSGRGDGLFDPDGAVSRAEFCVMANRAFNISKEGPIDFSDVKTDNFYYADVRSAVLFGYLSGYDDGSVRPADKLTRTETAVIMCKILKLKSAAGGAKKFSDIAAIPAWGLPSVESAVFFGIMSGYPEGEFRPRDFLTRAQACVIIASAIEFSQSDKPAEAPAGAVEPEKKNVIISSDYGPKDGVETINGNVTVTKNNISISNLVITGDLIIEPSSGIGSINLKNVRVLGEIYVNGE